MSPHTEQTIDRTSPQQQAARAATSTVGPGTL